MIPARIVKGIPIIHVVFFEEEEFTNPVITCEIDICRIEIVFIQNISQEVEELGTPDIVVLAGIDRGDDRAVVVALYIIGAVFRQHHPGCRFIKFLYFQDSKRHAVAIAKSAYLHTDIGLGAVGLEDHRFFAGGFGKGLVVSVVDVLGFAEEEFTDAAVAIEREADLILLARLKLNARVIDQSGIINIVAVSQIGDGQDIAFNRVADCRRNNRSLVEVFIDLANPGGDGVAIADIAKLHPKVRMFALGLEYQTSRERVICKGAVIAVVQILRFADEYFANAVISVQIYA